MNLRQKISDDVFATFGIEVSNRELGNILQLYDKTDLTLKEAKEKAISEYESFRVFVFSLVKHFGCSGKNKYPDRKTAKQWSKRRKIKSGVDLSIYQCAICHQWHLTSQTNMDDPDSQYFLDV